jgi:transcriptional regulator with GAF, ATPase, and Fis domain
MDRISVNNESKKKSLSSGYVIAKFPDPATKSEEAVLAAKNRTIANQKLYERTHNERDETIHKKERFIRALSHYEGNIAKAAKRAGTSRRTVYYWKKKDEAFAKAVSGDHQGKYNYAWEEGMALLAREGRLEPKNKKR